MKLNEILDIANLEKMITDGYINVQKHPTQNLWIYNYSNQTMFDSIWNKETMTCRGLIVDEHSNVISRPFSKFFSESQLKSLGISIPYGESFQVFEKYDGSLGVSYYFNDIWNIATRGSFVSEQAKEATKILNEKYSNVQLNPEYTYLFEIIFSMNRIVVDYGDKRDLILLAIIETATGKEIPLSEAPFGLNLVTQYHGVSDFSKVMNQFEHLSGTEFEGLVVRFESGFRVKLKTEDYKKLHKIYTGLSERDIWDCLSNGIGVEEIVSTAPDEMFDWIRVVVERLKNDFARVEAISKMLYLDGVRLADEIHPKTFENQNDSDKFRVWKKEHAKIFAMFVLKCETKLLQSVAFAMYRGFSYNKTIWEHLYPDGNKKFRVVSDIE